LFHPLPIPEWKWEVVTMDFITKFPRTSKQHDVIMVVVDKLTKAANFILIKVTHKATNVFDIYMREVPRLHGIPEKIVFIQRVRNKVLEGFIQRVYFASKFWKGLFKGFETNMNFSIDYHP
jgi:hypothetical protein